MIDLNDKFDVMVLCGGLGTRVESVSNGKPKFLLDIAGRPLYKSFLSNLKKIGISKVTLLAGHNGSQIANAKSQMTKIGIDVEVKIEEQPSGTLGCLALAVIGSSKKIMVINGDTIHKFKDVNLWMESCLLKNKNFLLTCNTNNEQDTGEIISDINNRIISFREKPIESDAHFKSAGIYFFERLDVKVGLALGMRSIENEFLPYLVEKENLYCTPNAISHFHDFGTPERLETGAEFLSGHILENTSYIEKKAV